LQGKGPGETVLPPYFHYSGDSFDPFPLAEVQQTWNDCVSKRSHALKLGSPIQYTPSSALTIDPYDAPANNGICEPSQDIPIISSQQNGQDCHPQPSSSTLESFLLFGSHYESLTAPSVNLINTVEDADAACQSNNESQPGNRSPASASRFGFELLMSDDSAAQTTTGSCIISRAEIYDGQVHPSHKLVQGQQLNLASFTDAANLIFRNGNLWRLFYMDLRNIVRELLKVYNNTTYSGWQPNTRITFALRVLRLQVQKYYSEAYVFRSAQTAEDLFGKLLEAIQKTTYALHCLKTDPTRPIDMGASFEDEETRLNTLVACLYELVTKAASPGNTLQTQCSNQKIQAALRTSPSTLASPMHQTLTVPPEALKQPGMQLLASYCEGTRPSTERDPPKKCKHRQCGICKCFKRTTNVRYASPKTNLYICRPCHKKNTFSYPCAFATSHGCSATFKNRQDANTHARWTHK
jgi:hypothetical protein